MRPLAPYTIEALVWDQAGAGLAVGAVGGARAASPVSTGPSLMGEYGVRGQVWSFIVVLWGQDKVCAVVLSIFSNFFTG